MGGDFCLGIRFPLSALEITSVDERSNGIIMRTMISHNTHIFLTAVTLLLLNVSLATAQQMILIPAGSFNMGDRIDEIKKSEQLQHTVYLDAYYIDVHEITNAEYVTFLNDVGNHVSSNGITWIDISSEGALIELTEVEEEEEEEIYQVTPGFENHPVVKVSWYGAAVYAQWAGKRLPTEAEWEKAARGGRINNRYPWGDRITYDHANYRGTGGGDYWETTSPVGSFPPNDYGLYDVAGNVWEWCIDQWDMDFYQTSPLTNPVSGGWISFVENSLFEEVDENENRVFRSGSWLNSLDSLRVANRENDLPTSMHFDLGFRCAKTASQ